MCNFMCLLDSFISFKSHQLAKDVEVNVYPHSSVEDIVSEESLELEYKHYVFHDAASKGLPLKFFESQPVVGKKAAGGDVRYRFRGHEHLCMCMTLPRLLAAAGLHTCC